MMALAVILTVLTATGVVQVWMILVLAVLLGCANAVDMPVRQAFAIEMVGPRDIGNAVAINSAMFNGARVVGPAVAGLTIGAFGMAPAFAINALSFLAVIVGLMLMRDDELHLARLVPRPRSAGAVVENLREGLAFVRHTPIVLLAVTTVGLVATFGMNFQVVIPPLAQDALGSDASGYGFLMAASGIGALGAAVALVLSGRPRTGRIVGGAILLGVASILLAMSTSFPISLLLMVPIGAGGIAMAATANATIQLAVPDGLRGRVMSVYTTVFSASMPIGGLLMGALASTLGILEAIAIGGVLSLISGIGAFVWYRRIRGREQVGASTRRRRRPGRRGPSVDGAEHQRGVQSAEAERGAQHPSVGPLATGPEQARQQLGELGFRPLEIDRRRRPSVADRQRADRRLDGTGRAERMAIQRLRPAHGHACGALAQRDRRGARLGHVADRRR